MKRGIIILVYRLFGKPISII